MSVFVASRICPVNVEWPMGHVEQVIQSKSGLRIAIKPSFSRIQLYDNNWNFLRGWNVDKHGGGQLKARLLANDTLEVWASSRSGKSYYLYSLDGKELMHKSNTGDSGPDDLSGKSEYIRTPFPLLVFSNPIIGWLLGLVGGFLAWRANPDAFPRRR